MKEDRRRVDYSCHRKDPTGGYWDCGDEDPRVPVRKQPQVSGEVHLEKHPRHNSKRRLSRVQTWNCSEGPQFHVELSHVREKKDLELKEFRDIQWKRTEVQLPFTVEGKEPLHTPIVIPSDCWVWHLHNQEVRKKKSDSSRWPITTFLVEPWWKTLENLLGLPYQIWS